MRSLLIVGGELYGLRTIYRLIECHGSWWSAEVVRSQHWNVKRGARVTLSKTQIKRWWNGWRWNEVGR